MEMRLLRQPHLITSIRLVRLATSRDASSRPQCQPVALSPNPPVNSVFSAVLR
jgi:hypothetical protein